MKKLKIKRSSFSLTTVILTTQCVLTGCSPAPSVVFFGASFPDWLLCSAIGCGGMTLLHIISSKLSKTGWLTPEVIVYPCVTALISMLSWLIFFPS
ncbi:YtcA family lipoprotein [Enterobacter roggenkampii]|uniref:YtcA family lipoprotein n=1 Tax=Enterobacter roggenkampii TaxID=1812935 RepID=UPI002DB670FC|nr:YtcA family lipoprotein [Enterobacter roggenkampii]MEB6622846.1 YtcA family lipoprotein [Enterobacter roggenkampii]